MPSFKFVAKVFTGSVRALTKTGADATKMEVAKNLSPMFAAQRKNATICAADAFHSLSATKSVLSLRDTGSRAATGAKKAFRSFYNRVTRNEAFGSYTYLFDDKPVRDLVLAPGRKLVEGTGRAIAGGVSDAKLALSALRTTTRRTDVAKQKALMPAPVALPTTEPAQQVTVTQVPLAAEQFTSSTPIPADPISDETSRTIRLPGETFWIDPNSGTISPELLKLLNSGKWPKTP